MKKPSIKKNYLLNALMNGLNLLFPIITFPYISRVLGPEGSGKIDFANSIVTYFMLLASLGIPLYGMREMAKVRDDEEKMSTLFSELFFLNLGLMLLSMAGFFAVLFSVGKIRAETPLFLITSLGVVLSLFSFDWLYSAIENFKYIAVRNILVKLVCLACMFILVRDSGDYAVYAAIGIFAAGGANLFNAVYSRKFVKLRVKGIRPFRHFKGVITLFAMSAAISIYNSLPRTLLGFMSGEKYDYTVGLYSAALKLEQILLTVLTSLSAVTSPRFSYYAETGNQSDYDRLLSKTLRFAWMLGVPAAVGLFLLAEPVLGLFAGSRFLPALPALRWMAPIVLISALSNVLIMQVFFPRKREKTVIFSALIGITVSLSLNFILIPGMKENGAAIAFLAAELVTMVFLAFSSRKIFGVRFFPAGTVFYLLFGAGMAVVICLLRRWISSSILFMLVSAVSGAMFYMGGLWLVRDPLVRELARWGYEKLSAFFGRRPPHAQS